MKTEDTKQQLDEIATGLKAMSETVRARFEMLKADRKPIEAALNSAMRLESDQLLKKQLLTVKDQLDSDQATALETRSAFAELNRQAAKELASLQKFLDG